MILIKLEDEVVEEEVEEMEVETKAKTPQDKRKALSSIFSTNPRIRYQFTF